MSLMLCSLGMLKTHAQVGMPTNNPNKNSVLDLNRTDGTSNKGLLLPKVALTAANSPSPLSAHVAGMCVYNTATVGTGGNAVTPGEYYNDGTEWLRMPTSPWNVTGNTGNTTANFLGTTDAVDLAFKTNNTEQMRITQAGTILIGNNTVPTGGTNAKLIVDNGTTAGALQLIDGTQAAGKVLTSDANGLASWQPPAVQNPVNVPLSSAIYLPSSSVGKQTWYYTGIKITLPPGKWLISAEMLITKEGAPTGTNESWWVRSTFVNSATSPVTGLTPISTDIISKSYYISGLLPTGSQYSVIKGNVVIKNSTTANKTYYYNMGLIEANNYTVRLILANPNRDENKMNYQRIN